MSRGNLVVAGAFVASYLALDWISYIHPMQRFSITPWNPQPALAIALLMLASQRWLPIVFIAAVAAEWLVRGAAPLAPSTLLVGAVLALGYAAIARALSGRFAIGAALEARADVLRLVCVVAVGALGTGILYIAALLAGGMGPVEDPFIALAQFWIGDAVGIVVTLPLLLMLTVPERRAQLVSIFRGRESVAYAIPTVAALVLVLATPPAYQLKFFYVLFVPLVLLATRYGLVGATLAAVLIQGAIIVSGELAGHEALTVFELQAFMIALTITGLFLGVTVDERWRAEEEVQRTMRMAAAGEMAAALAHELNQPLAALTSYARASQLLAQAAAPDRARLEDTLGKLVAEAGRAAEVVRRLRDFFRTGATRLAPASLHDVASRVVALLAARAQALGVALDHQVAEPLPPLMVDEMQLEVVIRNLLSNALEAAAGREGERSVRLQIVCDAGMVKATVTDSGAGVAANDAQRIFEPFTTTRAAGMGMGLAISRAIIEAHGGKLWAEAGARGVFCFTLPTSEA